MWLTGVLLCGCANLDYYRQAIGGHLEIMAKRRDIDAIIEDPNTNPTVRGKLRQVERMRQFSERELILPADGSYRTYVDLGRPYVTWTVVAAPELSLAPLNWCFPVVGCLAYRGYFSREAAQAYAGELRAAGYDVHVSGASAYSTLGWFDDPVLNTMLGRRDWQLAGFIFHELAHQRLYLQGDSTFSESYAVAVEREGVRRWLSAHREPAEQSRYERHVERLDAALGLLAETRERLAEIYASDRSDPEKRTEKSAAFGSLQQAYRASDASQGGGGGLAAWFDGGPNNARLALLATYNQLVPAFDALIARHAPDMAEFHRAAEGIASLSPPEREQAMEQLVNAR